MGLKPDIQKYISELTSDSDLYKDYELQIEELCKRLELKCYMADFDDNISGAIIKDNEGDTYSIYSNRKNPRNRQRFTLAHEIGHYISYLKDSHSSEELKKNGAFEDQAISYRKEGVFSDAETEANLIAAEILMPKKKVEELVQKSLTPEDMAEKFYVSTSAMTIRLQSLYPELMVI